MQESFQQAIERYLRSGEHDAHFRPWPGDNYVAQARYGSVALRQTLISAVRHRTAHAELPAALSGSSRSSSPGANPSLPARPTAAFTTLARGCGPDRHCSRNMRRGRCRRTTDWMWTTTSRSCAKRSPPATAGNASWHGARRPRVGRATFLDLPAIPQALLSREKLHGSGSSEIASPLAATAFRSGPWHLGSQPRPIAES